MDMKIIIILRIKSSLIWNSGPLVSGRKIFESMSFKRYILTCTSIETSEQYAHSGSMIRVFNGHSVSSRGFQISSGGKTLWVRRLIRPRKNICVVPVTLPTPNVYTKMK